MGHPLNPQIKLLKKLIEVIIEKFEQQFSLNQKLPPCLYFSTSTGTIKITILGDVRFIPAHKYRNRKAHIRSPSRKKEPVKFLIEAGKKITIIPATKRQLDQKYPLKNRFLFTTPVNEIKNLISSIRESPIQTQ